MKNKLIKITYIFIIFVMLYFNFKIVYAVTEEDLKEQISDIDNKIDNTNTEIAGLEEQMSNELEQINRLNIQIKEYEDEIANIQSELEESNAAFEQKKLELDEITAEYNKQKSSVEARLVAMYESSKTTYLDVLFGSSDITDFISKYYLLQQIADCDSESLNELSKKESNIEREKDKLEDAKNEVQATQERLTVKQNAMGVLIRDKTNLIGLLSDEELELEAQLEQFEEDKKRIEEELIELAKQNAIKASITPSECGYISPLLRKNF